MSANHITFLGDDSRTGAYILWLRVRSELTVAFGRFQRGEAVDVPPGLYAYVGSALGGGGLARRLLRHATRTGGRPAHTIRAPLRAECERVEVGAPGLRPPDAKRLRWHVDYLLDEVEVEIDQITAVRTAARMESVLARRLSALPGVAPLAPGLGAGDARGETHLMRYSYPDTIERMETIIAERIQPGG